MLATPQVQSVIKAFKILSFFDGSNPDLSLKSLAKLSNMSVSTTHRFLQTLTAVGAIKVDTRGNYSISNAIGNLAANSDDASSWRVTVNDILRALTRELSATSHFCVAHDDMVRCVAKSEGPEKLDLETYVGIEYDCYFSSTGKIILAHLPKSHLNEYLLRGGFVKMTPHTIIDSEELSRDLEAVRTNGFALDQAEFVEGVFCLAVPVRYDRRVIGGLSCSIPGEQWAESRIPELCGILQRHAAQIETSLAAQRMPPEFI